MIIHYGERTDDFCDETEEIEMSEEITIEEWALRELGPERKEAFDICGPYLSQCDIPNALINSIYEALQSARQQGAEESDNYRLGVKAALETGRAIVDELDADAKKWVTIEDREESENIAAGARAVIRAIRTLEPTP